jgi:hypothetical protein
MNMFLSQAMMSRTRRDLARRFYEAGALAPDRALRLTDLSPAAQSRLRRFVENHIAHEAEPGVYWLDGAAYEADFAHRRRLVILAVLVVLIVLFFVVEIAGGMAI